MIAHIIHIIHSTHHTHTNLEKKKHFRRDADHANGMMKVLIKFDNWKSNVKPVWNTHLVRGSVPHKLG